MGDPICSACQPTAETETMDDLFTSLSIVPFDFRMVGYQEDDTFGTNTDLDFGTTVCMRGNYDMSMYLNESSLNSINGS